MSTIGNIKYVDANAFRFDSRHINDHERKNNEENFTKDNNELNLGK